jgi:uncharacterized protein (TIGR02145 family)
MVFLFVVSGMNKNKSYVKNKIVKFVFIISWLGFFIISCERDYNNPWDEKSTLDPSAWTPQNLQITDVSITEKKLTWAYTGDDLFEGFKIDRKVSNGDWQLAYTTVGKEVRSWNDNQIIPDPEHTYTYRLKAFAGQYSSSYQEQSKTAAIPAPENLQIEKLTDKSYQLSWTDNVIGEQGYKIDRKIDNGNWQTSYGVVSANLATFIDTNVFQKSSSAINVEYQVYSFYQNYQSVKTNISTNAELTAPANLVITQTSITSVTLTWQDISNGEEGFRIERKYEGSSWFPLATITENNYVFADSNFELNTQVYYRICAYLVSYSSSYIEKDFDATIPAPSNLVITPNSITSITLTWQDNSNGEEGFKIDRKENNGSWVISYATVNANQETFSDNVTDLTNNTYSYRVYAFVNQYESQKVEAMTVSCGFPYIDTRDGTQYETVEIGTQCWMKENLAYLPSVSPPSGGSQTSSYYYVYDYSGTSVSTAKATANYQTYGVLYNWPASLTACPQGWHLPSDSKWNLLESYLGGSSVAGGKMKEAGIIHWSSPNTEATNESGFTGLPGGFRGSNGSFSTIGNFGYFWSSTEHSSSDAWRRNLSFLNGVVNRGYHLKDYGFSIRCLRDE